MAYQADLKQLELLNGKQGILALKDQKEKEDILDRLQNFDQKLKRGTDLYIQERERKSKTAQDHNL